VSPVGRGLVVFGIGLALILGGVGLGYVWLGGDAFDAGLAASVGGPFALTDQNGVLRHDTDFRGDLMLVYFGYSYCPDACPTSLNSMTAALEKLGPRAQQIQPLFITIDPERDTVAQMKLYASNFDPRLLALTGTPDEIAAAARAYRVFYQKVKGDSPDDYTMDHSSLVFLMGRDGRFLTYFGADVNADAMAAMIKKYL
jgi:protein SCO1/2